MNIRTTLLLFLSLASLHTFAQEEKCITLDELPPRAKYFIRNDMTSYEIASVSVNERKKTYNIITSDSCEVVFDEDGQWTSIDCNKGQIPELIIPNKIHSEIRKEFGVGAKIVSVERLSRGRYDVTLSRRINVKFNHHLEIVGIKELFKRSE